MFSSKGWITPKEIKDMLIEIGGKNIPIPKYSVIPIKYIVKYEKIYYIIGDSILAFGEKIGKNDRILSLGSVDPIIRMCNEKNLHLRQKTAKNGGIEGKQ